MLLTSKVYIVVLGFSKVIICYFVLVLVNLTVISILSPLGKRFNLKNSMLMTCDDVRDVEFLIGCYSVYFGEQIMPCLHLSFYQGKNLLRSSYVTLVHSFGVYTGSNNSS